MTSIDQTNAILELVNFDLIILKNKTKDERELIKEDFLNSFNENIMQIRLLCLTNTFDEIINSFDTIDYLITIRIKNLIVSVSTCKEQVNKSEMSDESQKRLNQMNKSTQKHMEVQLMCAKEMSNTITHMIDFVERFSLSLGIGVTKINVIKGQTQFYLDNGYVFFDVKGGCDIDTSFLNTIHSNAMTWKNDKKIDGHILDKTSEIYMFLNAIGISDEIIQFQMVKFPLKIQRMQRLINGIFSIDMITKNGIFMTKCLLNIEENTNNRKIKIDSIDFSKKTEYSRFLKNSDKLLGMIQFEIIPFKGIDVGARISNIQKATSPEILEQYNFACQGQLEIENIKDLIIQNLNPSGGVDYLVKLKMNEFIVAMGLITKNKIDILCASKFSGLGRHILGFMETHIKTKNVKFISLSAVSEAIGFYLKQGYKFIPEKMVFMEKGLVFHEFILEIYNTANIWKFDLTDEDDENEFEEKPELFNLMEGLGFEDNIMSHGTTHHKSILDTWEKMLINFISSENVALEGEILDHTEIIMTKSLVN